MFWWYLWLKLGRHKRTFVWIFVMRIGWLTLPLTSFVNEKQKYVPIYSTQTDKCSHQTVNLVANIIYERGDKIKLKSKLNIYSSCWDAGPEPEPTFLLCLSEGMEDMYSIDKMTYSKPVKRNYVNLDTGGCGRVAWPPGGRASAVIWSAGGQGAANKCNYSFLTKYSHKKSNNEPSHVTVINW